MPNVQGKAKKGGKDKSQFGDYKFVSHRLSADEKRAFDAWHIDAEAILKRVMVLVDMAYKVSVSLDFYNHTTQASLTCNEVKSPDSHWILVARAPDAMTALALLIFKHDVLMDGDWTNWHDEDHSDRIWG